MSFSSPREPTTVVWRYGPMRKLAVISVLVALLTPARGVSALSWTVNLLTNPGAEAGIMEDWIPEPPVVVSMSQWEDSGWVYPYSGDWFFNMGSVSVAPSGVVAGRTLYQDVDVGAYASSIDAGLLLVHAAAWLQTEDLATVADADYAQLTLRFLDEFGSPIGSLSTGLVQSPNLTWAEQTLDGTSPAGTRVIRFELLGEKHESYFINAYFDDASLQVAVVPEPASAIMLGLGAAALILRRRAPHA